MKIKNMVISVMTFLFIVLCAGCGYAEVYGEKISGNKITAIGDILSKPASYNGMTVVVKGKIVRECPTGCWFDLEEKGAIIYIDINPSGFAIPQKVGHQATVEGDVLVTNEKPVPVLIGKGVDVR